MRFATLHKKNQNVLAEQSELGTPAVGSPAVDSSSGDFSRVNLSKIEKEERLNRLKKYAVKTTISLSSY